MKAVKPRSICFLTNTYPDTGASYRGSFIKKMAELLRREGYDITVVTPKVYRESHYVEEMEGTRVYRFPFFAGDKLLIEYEKIPYLRMMFYYMTGVVITLYAALKHRCDLIHVHWAIPTGLIGVFCELFLRKSLLVTIHGSDFRLATGKSRVLRTLFFWVCKKADHLICVSEVMKKGIVELGIAEEKVSTFPMGVDERFLEAGRSRNIIGHDRAMTVFSNRNLLPLYNVTLLIQSIPLILGEEPKVRFLIAGEGPERDRLMREAKNIKVEQSVQFLGRVPHEWMPELLAKTDIYVSTSLFDGTSVSLLEAMASGAFPVVTDIPANAEWIKDGENGLLVPASDKGELARKILLAVRNREMMERGRGQNIRTIEENALWRVTITKAKRIYDHMLAAKEPSPMA